MINLNAYCCRFRDNIKRANANLLAVAQEANSGNSGWPMAHFIGPASGYLTLDWAAKAKREPSGEKAAAVNSSPLNVPTLLHSGYEMHMLQFLTATCLVSPFSEDLATICLQAANDSQTHLAALLRLSPNPPAL